jgi:hypothetical protein
MFNLKGVIFLDFVFSTVIFLANDGSTHVGISFLQENVVFIGDTNHLQIKNGAIDDPWTRPERHPS